MDIDKKIRLLKETTISIYTDLSEDDKHYIGKDLNSVLHSDSISDIKNLSLLYDYLNECKKSIQKVDFIQEFSENQGYQRALQKLDKEIRYHIRSELQMKVYIDSLEEKIKTMSSQKKLKAEINAKLVDKLIDTNNKLKSTLASKNQEFADVKTTSRDLDEKEILLLKNQIKRDAEKTLEIEKNSQKIRQMIAKGRVELDSKNKEYEKHKLEFSSLRNMIASKDDLRSLSNNRDRSERGGIDSLDVIIKGQKISKSPKKAVKSFSPVPLNSKQKAFQQSKVSSSNIKLDNKSSLVKILQTNLSRFKIKSRLPINSNYKK
jgi:hypothetical protein